MKNQILYLFFLFFLVMVFTNARSRRRKTAGAGGRQDNFKKVGDAFEVDYPKMFKTWANRNMEMRGITTRPDRGTALGRLFYIIREPSASVIAADMETLLKQTEVKFDNYVYDNNFYKPPRTIGKAKTDLCNILGEEPTTDPAYLMEAKCKTCMSKDWAIQDGGPYRCLFNSDPVDGQPYCVPNEGSYKDTLKDSLNYLAYAGPELAKLLSKGYLWYHFAKDKPWSGRVDPLTPLSPHPHVCDIFRTQEWNDKENERLQRGTKFDSDRDFEDAQNACVEAKASKNNDADLQELNYIEKAMEADATQIEATDFILAMSPFGHVALAAAAANTLIRVSTAQVVATEAMLTKLKPVRNSFLHLMQMCRELTSIDIGQLTGSTNIAAYSECTMDTCLNAQDLKAKLSKEKIPQDAYDSLITEIGDDKDGAYIGDFVTRWLRRIDEEASKPKP